MNDNYNPFLRQHVLAVQLERTYALSAVGDELSEDEDGLNIGATAMFEDFFGTRSGMKPSSRCLASCGPSCVW